MAGHVEAGTLMLSRLQLSGWWWQLRSLSCAAFGALLGFLFCSGAVTAAPQRLQLCPAPRITARDKVSYL